MGGKWRSENAGVENMSSWIVKPITINRIVSFLSWNDGGILGVRFKQMFGELNAKECEKLGQQMIKLNCRAVSKCYNQPINKEKIKEYAFSDVWGTTAKKEQVLKTLDCFLYQCNEGNISKTKIYKNLEKARQLLADEIISKIPEYDKAAWE